MPGVDGVRPDDCEAGEALGGFLPPAAGPGEDVLPAAPVIAPAPAAQPCGRQLVERDSIRWRCACGAAGRVGRDADGIPYLTDELLRHEPGEQKEGA